MRKIREVLRLRLEADLSVRQISCCTKVSVGSILLKSAQALGLTWPLPTELDDGRLAALFYPQACNDPAVPAQLSGFGMACAGVFIFSAW